MERVIGIGGGSKGWEDLLCRGWRSWSRKSAEGSGWYMSTILYISNSPSECAISID